MLGFLSNGSHYLCVGGRGFCLGAGKTEARKMSELPQDPTLQVHLRMTGAMFRRGTGASSENALLARYRYAKTI
jgi:hypothetical protein